MNHNASVPRTSALAVISLVFGILGWLPLPLIGSVVAIVTGHLARAEIRRDVRLDGDSMAVAGLVLGYSSLVFALLVFAAIITFMGLLAYPVEVNLPRR